VADPIQIGVVPPVTDPPTESGLTVTAIVLAGEGHKGAVVYLLTTLTSKFPSHLSKNRKLSRSEVK
jgi:hypothetical protein